MRPFLSVTQQRLVRFLVLGAASTALGCGADPATPSAGAESSAGAAGSAAGGTAMPAGGGGSSGAATANAGTSLGGAGGALAGAGGAALGGAAGAAPDDSAAAEVLRGYLLEKPCAAGFVPTPNVNQTCPEAPEVETQHHSEQFGGDANVTYQVKLRVRGVNERHWFTGGAVDPSQLFYVGGLPTAHSPLAPGADFTVGKGACPMHPPETDDKFPLPFELPTELRPSDGCFNAYTIFALIVGSPKQTYFLNYTDDFDGKDRPAHIVHATDYTVTVPIQGQASLDFYVVDGDHHQVTNDGTLSVEGLTVTQPYNGTVLQLDVVDVTRAP